jgi:hypothetical protein
MRRIPIRGSRWGNLGGWIQTQLRHMHECVRACMCATSATFCAGVTPACTHAGTCARKHLLAAIKTPHERHFHFHKSGSPHSGGKWGEMGERVCVHGHSNFPVWDPRVAARLRLDTGGVLGYFFPPFLINFWGVGPNFLSQCCVPLFIFHSSSNIINLVATTKRGAINLILILFAFSIKER